MPIGLKPLRVLKGVVERGVLAQATNGINIRTALFFDDPIANGPKRHVGDGCLGREVSAFLLTVAHNRQLARLPTPAAGGFVFFEWQISDDA